MTITEQALNEYHLSQQLEIDKEVAEIKSTCEELFGCDMPDFEIHNGSEYHKHHLVFPEWPNLQFARNPYTGKMSVRKTQDTLKNGKDQIDISSILEFGCFLVEEEIIGRKKKDMGREKKKMSTQDRLSMALCMVLDNIDSWFVEKI